MEARMEPPPEARELAYDSSGVDVTLIRWMLEMTPAERLEALQSFVDATWRARSADDET
jgi:hypothetical protein